MQNKRKPGVAMCIAKARRRMGLTQAGLAERLCTAGVAIKRVGVAKTNIGTRPVRGFELVALALALGVSVNWLLKWRT